MTPPSDCRSCGVCCFSPSPVFVRVTGDDWQRLGAAAEQFAHFQGNRAFMQMRDGHCAALDVRREASGAVDFFCTVYEQRPTICRALGRGSAECLGELATKSETAGGRGTGVSPVICDPSNPWAGRPCHSNPAGIPAGPVARASRP